MLWAVLAFCGMSANAQWATPGTGHTYTMENLVAISQGSVQSLGDKTYLIADTVTISANDLLTIGEDVQQIIFDDQMELVVRGGITCGNQVHETVFTGYEDHEYGFFNLRLEDCTSECTFAGVRFVRGCGFQLINVNASFNGCAFMGFSTKSANAAIDLFQCSPVIANCLFMQNEGGAISSAANSNGSPQIINNNIVCNVTLNENYPQINLGSGSENDTIRIVGNYIEGGGFSLSGGIAIADLMGTGNTKVLLKDNLICNNRYGYNQQGYNISSLILNNQFLDNNAETDPMNGGSGISIYGMDGNNKAILRDNVISGNLWGITTIYYNDVDMGTADDPGHNIIFGNHNAAYGEDADYALYVNSFSDISAIGNYWGYNDESFAESVIYHRPDLGDTFGQVSYLPIHSIEPDVLSFRILQEDNDFLPHDYEGLIDHVNHTIEIDIPAEYINEPYLLCIRFEIPDGTVCGLESGEVIDLTEPVTMPVGTPHGDQVEWTITLNVITEISEQAEEEIQVYCTASEIVLHTAFEQAELHVYDTLGHCVYSGRTIGTQHHISTMGWSKGIYVVNIDAPSVSVSRIIVVK